MLQAIGLTSAPRKDLPPAVDDLTFEACPGRVTALLGEPGAGKTTALRLMLELEPGRGVTYFRGRPLHRIPHPAREVGVLLGDVPGHPARTVRGQLRMLCAAVGVPASRADAMLEVVGISGLRDQRLGSLSLGMDRRVGLAAALLADPCTLLLDEPSAGLSPRDQSWLYRLLRGHAELGGAVLFTTSDAKEAARSADRVVSIAGGRLVADQEAADFARTRLRPRVAVRTPHAARLAALLGREARAAQKSVEIVEESGSRLSVYGSSCAEVGETAFRHGVLVHQLADETGDSGPTLPRPTAPRSVAGAGTAPRPDTGGTTRPAAAGRPAAGACAEATRAALTPPPGAAEAATPTADRAGTPGPTSSRRPTAPSATSGPEPGHPPAPAGDPRGAGIPAASPEAAPAPGYGDGPGAVRAPGAAGAAFLAAEGGDPAGAARIPPAPAAGSVWPSPSPSVPEAEPGTRHEPAPVPGADGPAVHGGAAPEGAVLSGYEPDGVGHRVPARAAEPGTVLGADGGFFVGSGSRPVRVAADAKRVGPAPAAVPEPETGTPLLPVRAPAPTPDAGADPRLILATGAGTHSLRPLRVPGEGAEAAARSLAVREPARRLGVDVPAGSGQGTDADTRPLPVLVPGTGAAGDEPLPDGVPASGRDAGGRPASGRVPGSERGVDGDARVRSGRGGAARGADADGRPRPARGDSADATGAGPAADAGRQPSPGAHGVPGQGRYSAGGPRHARTGAPVSAVRRVGGPLRPWRYELRRAFGTAVVPVVTAAAAVLSVLITLLLARGGHVPQTRLLAAWPTYLPLPPAALAAGLLGALAFGEEYRFPALAADRGTVPRRLGLLLAKLGVSAGLALFLGGLAVTADAAALRLVFDTDLIRTPADWMSPAVSWAGLLVGCAWAGVLASGVFRSATAGLAAVLAVPVLVVPLVRKVFDGPSAYPVAGLSARLRGLAWAQWPPEADRLVMGALRVMAQPVGTALALSLTVLMCAYGFTGLRSRVRW